jgi:hypothetical protein
VVEYLKEKGVSEEEAMRIAQAERSFSGKNENNWPTLGDFRMAVMRLGLIYKTPLSANVFERSV